MSKIHLTENIYFDTASGKLQEVVSAVDFSVCEPIGDGTGYATFGCLKDDEGNLLWEAIFPSTISCGDDRANGKRVTSVEDIKAAFAVTAN